MTQAREAELAEREALFNCLARAFETDPISSFIFPDVPSRRKRLVSFYRRVVPTIVRHGSIHTNEGLQGAAVWRAPAPPDMTAGRTLGDSLKMLLTLRGAITRAMRLDQITSMARPMRPHWYLALLGTEPSCQGQGVGSALLAPVLARCDAEGVLAYLESSKVENIPFYERHGFRVTEELRLPDGPCAWAMQRAPETEDGALNSAGSPTE